MSDIVERLRETIVAHDEWHQGRLKTSDTVLERFSRERHEAAEEITKLRADKAAWQGVQQGTADVVKQLEKENEKLRAALIKLANASDDIGVMFFDTDDLSDEVEAMREATLEARAAAATALKETGDE